MTTAEKKEFKQILQQHAVKVIQQRIREAKFAMDDAQQSANAEEKSSAGDKYETSRAMSHLQKDMHAKQLAANNQELAGLLAIGYQAIYHSVATGSVIICGHISFFIAAGIGKQVINGEEIYFLSAAAPLARSLFGKTTGDVINFNKLLLMINDVF